MLPDPSAPGCRRRAASSVPIQQGHVLPVRLTAKVRPRSMPLRLGGGDGARGGGSVRCACGSSEKSSVRRWGLARGGVARGGGARGRTFVSPTLLLVTDRHRGYVEA